MADNTELITPTAEEGENLVTLEVIKTGQLDGTNLNKIARNFTAIEQAFEEDRTEISAIQEQIGTITGETIEQLTQRVADAEEDISTNSQNISTNSQNITTNSGNISKNAEAISKNAGDIATNASAITTINETTIPAINTRIDNTNTTITNLKAGSTSTIKSLDEGISANAEAIEDLRGDSTESISGLDERIDSLESNAVLKTPTDTTVTQSINSPVAVQKNLTVEGNLVVKGNIDQENVKSLLVEDNIIVTNSNNAQLGATLSGLAINTGSTTYGIVYHPSEDTVKLGSGSVSSGGIFTFASGEGQPVATRADSSTFTNKHFPIWDSVNNRFIDSAISSEFISWDSSKTVNSVVGEYAFAKPINFTNSPINSNILPNTADGVSANNLGSSTKRWTGVYAVNTNTESIKDIDNTNNYITFGDSLLLKHQSAVSVESPTFELNSSVVDISNNPTFTGNITPTSTNTYNLGSSTNKWANLYAQYVNAIINTTSIVGDNLTITSNSVNVTGVLNATTLKEGNAPLNTKYAQLGANNSYTATNTFTDNGFEVVDSENSNIKASFSLLEDETLNNYVKHTSSSMVSTTGDILVSDLTQLNTNNSYITKTIGDVDVNIDYIPYLSDYTAITSVDNTALIPTYAQILISALDNGTKLEKLAFTMVGGPLLVFNSSPVLNSYSDDDGNEHWELGVDENNTIYFYAPSPEDNPSVLPDDVFRIFDVTLEVESEGEIETYSLQLPKRNGTLAVSEQIEDMATQSGSNIWTGSNVYTTRPTFSNGITSQNILPQASNIYDIGSSTNIWRNVYAMTLYENGSSLATKYGRLGSINEWTSGNTFKSRVNSDVGFMAGSDANNATTYRNGEIRQTVNNITYTYNLPTPVATDNTLATLSDIENISGNLTTFARLELTADQTFNGEYKNIFNTETWFNSGVYADSTISAKELHIATDVDGTTYTSYGDGAIYKKYESSSSSLYTYTLPNTSGTIALTKDIPSLSNYVTLSTAQTISGNKTFNGAITLNGGVSSNILPTGSSQTLGSTSSKWGSIYGTNIYGTLVASAIKDETETYTLNIPQKNGTLATTSDIPTNYVTTDTNQTITARKDFEGTVAHTGILTVLDGANLKILGTDNQQSRWSFDVGNRAIRTYTFSSDWNNIYNYTFPEKSGTVALVESLQSSWSDITTTDSRWTTKTFEGETYNALKFSATSTVIEVYAQHVEGTDTYYAKVTTQPIYDADDSSFYVLINSQTESKVACKVRSISI